MNNVDNQYLALVQDILDNGVERGDRTGTGTLSVFGRFLRFDLQQGFPLLTTKKVHFKSIVHELLWFLSGSSNVKYLQENGVSIWNEWADENGSLGRPYGVQWRNWMGAPNDDADNTPVVIDQIKEVVSSIKNNPNSRRHLISAWNVADINKMALPPCHYAFQFYVANNKLSCMWQQRSADTILGIPFNIASYALLTHMMASICNLEVGELCASLGDAHLYINHLDQAKEQLARQPKELPNLILTNNNYQYPEEFKFEDIKLEGYDPHPAIKAPIAV